MSVGLPASTGTSALGTVYDRGYRPYEGMRGGRTQARWALWRLTVRRALGLRRSWRQKVLPWSLLGLVTVPAMVDVGVRYATRDTPAYQVDFEFLDFREYVGVSTLLLLFVAVAAPDVVCPDRHDRVLPLIFSRQLTGADYVAAKVGGVFFIVFGFSFLPQVVLFLGQLFVSDDGSINYLRDNAEVMWQVPAAVAVLALYYAVISVALASITDRRIVGGIALLGLFLVTSAIAGVFVETSDSGGSAMALINLLSLPLVLRDLIFLGHVDPGSGFDGVEGVGPAAILLYVSVVCAGLGFLLWRYREVEL
jgi:ABC-2 type transport system permease protein